MAARHRNVAVRNSDRNSQFDTIQAGRQGSHLGQSLADAVVTLLLQVAVAREFVVACRTKSITDSIKVDHI
jgi:hypothetical protein